MARRIVTQQDRDIWDAAMRGVRRLCLAEGQQDMKPPAAPAPVAAAIVVPTAVTTVSAVERMPAVRAGRRSPLGPAAPRIGQRVAGLDDTSWRALTKGTMRVQRRLDLHGNRAQTAFERLHRFLISASREGLRCVEIVTGLGSGAEGGVLRRELPHWLGRADLEPLILAVVHPHAANQGSVRVLLRRGGR